MYNYASGGEMKKINSLIFVLLLIPVHSIGQSFIMTGGYSSFKNKVVDELDKSKGGFFGGLGFETGTGKLRVNNILVYSGRTHGIEFNGIPRWFRFDSFTDDLTLRYKILNESSPYLLGGGYISWIIYDRRTASGESLQDTFEYFFDYGFVFGIGIEFFFENFSLRVEGRYRHGQAYIEIDEKSFRTNELGIGLVFSTF